MPLSGYQYNITGLGKVARGPDGFPSIGDGKRVPLFLFRHTCLHIFYNLQWVLGARVIRGDNHLIADFDGRGGHFRALCSIPITPTAEYRNDLLVVFAEITDRFQYIPYRIRRMRIVNYTNDVALRNNGIKTARASRNRKNRKN